MTLCLLLFGGASLLCGTTLTTGGVFPVAMLGIVACLFGTGLPPVLKAIQAAFIGGLFWSIVAAFSSPRLAGLTLTGLAVVALGFGLIAAYRKATA